jgi:hypothetical protein
MECKKAQNTRTGPYNVFNQAHREQTFEESKTHQDINLVQHLYRQLSMSSEHTHLRPGPMLATGNPDHPAALANLDHFFPRIANPAAILLADRTQNPPQIFTLSRITTLGASTNSAKNKVNKNVAGSIAALPNTSNCCQLPKCFGPPTPQTCWSEMFKRQRRGGYERIADIMGHDDLDHGSDVSIPEETVEGKCPWLQKLRPLLSCQ